VRFVIGQDGTIVCAEVKRDYTRSPAHRSYCRRATELGPRKVIGFRSMFEDLNYEELKRRANARLPERVVATLEAHGERRSVAEGELLYGVDDASTHSSTRFRPLSRYGS